MSLAPRQSYTYICTATYKIYHNCAHVLADIDSHDNGVPQKTGDSPAVEKENFVKRASNGRNKKKLKIFKTSAQGIENLPTKTEFFCHSVPLGSGTWRRKIKFLFGGWGEGGGECLTTPQKIMGNC